MISSAFVKASVVLCLLGLQAGQALAQQPPRGSSSEATESDRLLDRIDFHPTYMTDYSVNRSSRNWGQTLNLTRKVGPFDLTNKWTVMKGKDPNRSDMRQKRGAMSFNLAYGLPDYGSWTFGLDGNFRRDSQLSSFRRVEDNNSDYGVAIKTGLPEQVMQSIFSPLSEFALRTDANLGYNRGDNVSQRSIRGATLIDSTEVSGFFQRFNADLGGTLLNLDLKARASTDRTSGDSRTRQVDLDGGGERPLIEDTSERSSEQLDGSVRWKPFEGLDASAAGRWVDEVNQYWDIQANSQQGGQETKRGKDRNSKFDLKWNPNKDTDIRAQYSLSWLEGKYDLQNLDFTKKRKAGEVNGRFVLPAFVGPMGGTQFDVKYAGEESENTLEQTANYTQTNRLVRLSAQRKLGSKFQLMATQEIQLQQYFYADSSNDRDDRRLFTDGNLSYRPNARFSGVFSVSWSKRESVSIPELRAANNNTRQSYKIDTDLTYTRRRLTINQRYTVQADYTFYDFNEDNNNLVRTNSVNTTLRTPLAPGTNVSLKHQYQHRDSGSYIRETDGGGRTYAQSNEETRHALTLGTRYSIGGVLVIDAEQLFDQRQSRRVTSDRVNTSTRAEFSLNASFSKEIAEDFMVKMNFRKTQSNSEKNYWTGRASVERRF
jgi:hypothetical protein